MPYLPQIKHKGRGIRAGAKGDMRYTCPVCGGNGKVMNGFYNQVGGMWTTSNSSFEKCRSCDGKGYVK